jgi:hypothetical protein
LSRLSNVAAQPAAAAADHTKKQQQLEQQKQERSVQLALISAVAAAWHDSTPEHTLKRTVASYLALQQGSKAAWRRVANHVNTTHKGPKGLGLKSKLIDILSYDQTGLFCFRKKSNKPVQLQLDMQKLLQLALQQQQQQQAQQMQQAKPMQQAQQQAQLHRSQGQLLFSSSSSPDAEQAAAATAGRSQQIPPVAQLQFEVQLQHNASGWLQPSFILHPQQLQQAVGQPQQHEDVGAAGGTQPATSSRLVGVAGISMQLEPLDSSSSSSLQLEPLDMYSSSSEAEGLAVASPEPNLDEAVCSMAQLLPVR